MSAASTTGPRRTSAGTFVAVGVLLAVLYQLFGTWSVGQGFGGIAADGGWVDWTGAPTSEAPLTVNVVGRPAPWVTAVLAGILVLAYLWSRRSERSAVRATVGLLIAAAFVAAVIGVFTFWQMHLVADAFHGGNPFPPILGNVDVERSRMAAS